MEPVNVERNPNRSGAAARRFGENLRRARLEAGVSQEALADAMEAHRTEISLLERGGREPRLVTIIRARDALRCSLDDLCDGLVYVIPPALLDALDSHQAPPNRPHLSGRAA